MKGKALVEVAVESLDHALRAEEMGADRIELCSALSMGGLTPSHGLIEACLTRLSIPIHVMIRCRPGNFVYSKDEMTTMLADARACAALGVGGLVFGFLNEDGSLDGDKTKALTAICKKQKLKTTFHRAIDVSLDSEKAIHQLIKIQIDHLLTSGLKPKAIEGKSRIESLVKQFGNEIGIMAGSGINRDTVHDILKTGVSAVHLTAHTYEQPGGEDKFEFGPCSRFDGKKLKSVLDVVKSY